MRYYKFSSGSFIKAPIKDVVTTFENWITPLITPFKNKIEATKIINQDINSAFRYLMPITSGDVRRYIFLETKSEWVAHFNNHFGESDPGTPANIGRLYGCPVINYYKFDQPRESFGLNFSYSDIDNDGEFDLLRTINLIKEVNLSFYEYGKPFSFEDVQRYKSKFKKERFDGELLKRYLLEFGLRPFEEDFYYPNNDEFVNGYFCKLVGKMFESTREIYPDEII